MHKAYGIIHPTSDGKSFYLLYVLEKDGEYQLAQGSDKDLRGRIPIEDKAVCIKAHKAMGCGIFTDLNRDGLVVLAAPKASTEAAKKALAYYLTTMDMPPTGDSQ